jgi:hypothetical protein
MRVKRVTSLFVYKTDMLPKNQDKLGQDGMNLTINEITGGHNLTIWELVGRNYRSFA